MEATSRLARLALEIRQENVFSSFEPNTQTGGAINRNNGYAPRRMGAAGVC